MKYKMLSETSNYMNGRVEVASLNLDNYISTENMMPNKGGVIEANKLPMGKTTTSYKKGDVLMWYDTSKVDSVKKQITLNILEVFYYGKKS
ncbi:hypothetical protein [Mycoplasma sp. P36-A1]|uniref:hypothetical protein n=1 Tax=Mycoplasma sp. P36-A1 TaxID=3252900 RepID=UPI003C2E98FA